MPNLKPHIPKPGVFTYTYIYVCFHAFCIYTCICVCTYVKLVWADTKDTESVQRCSETTATGSVLSVPGFFNDGAVIRKASRRPGQLPTFGSPLNPTSPQSTAVLLCHSYGGSYAYYLNLSQKDLNRFTPVGFDEGAHLVERPVREGWRAPRLWVDATGRSEEGAAG